MTMPKRSALFVLFFSLFFAANLFCQESDAQDFSALPIVQFNIDGLKRTKRSYMDGLLSHYLQKPASTETLKAIETTLQAQNLFDEIKVSARPLDGTSAAVDISFKEKWTILPMPFGYYTDGSYALGLFVMDMNALGQHCVAVAGGIYSPDKIIGAGVFSKPPAQKGKVGFSVAANASKGTNTFANAKNYAVFRYESFYAGLRGSILFKPTNSTSAKIGAGYSFMNPIDSPHVQRRNQWSVNASWGISKSNWNGFFLSANSFSLGGELLFSDASAQRFAQTLSFEGQVQQPVVDRLRMMTVARGFLSHDLYATNYVGRSASGLTLLPSSFATDQIFGLFTGFEAAVIKASFGIVSAYALMGLNLARDWNNSIYSCVGPEAGLRLYLAKIAFPAFAMGACYNINEKVWRFSFSGGASF